LNVILEDWLKSKNAFRAGKEIASSAGDQAEEEGC